MQFLAIIALCVVSAVVYGVLHDQVTARVCVEYFTVGHPPVFNTNDPTLLGLGWGVIATWWVGAFLGVPLAVAARVGSRPRRSAASLFKPIASLFAVNATCALVAGILGWILASAGVVWLIGPIASKLPRERHVPFLADMWAHTASYAIGFFGGLIVIAWVWYARGRAAALPHVGQPGDVR